MAPSWDSLELTGHATHGNRKASRFYLTRMCGNCAGTWYETNQNQPNSKLQNLAFSMVWFPALVCPDELQWATNQKVGSSNLSGRTITI